MNKSAKIQISQFFDNKKLIRILRYFQIILLGLQIGLMACKTIVITGFMIGNH